MTDMYANKKDELQENILQAETAIHEEVKKHTGLDFSELSPKMRELLVKVFLRATMDTIEKLKKESKEVLTKT